MGNGWPKPARTGGAWPASWGWPGHTTSGPITGPDIIPVFAPVQGGPLSQPITFADGRNPPMLLLAGDADTTVQPRNTTALAARIRERGGPVESKVYPGVGHIGIITAFAPLFRGNAPVLDDVWAFITARRPKG